MKNVVSVKKERQLLLHFKEICEQNAGPFIADIFLPMKRSQTEQHMRYRLNALCS